MRFINTRRFSPVVFEGDIPFKDDYFHKPIDEITKEFLEAGNYDIDEEWWRKQQDRCLNGYVVENAIEKGGDAYLDDKIAFWHGNDCEIPMYNLVIKDKKIFIPGRLYFYLNFWKIYGLPIGGTIKQFTNPKFIDIDFFFARRLEMMVEEAKNMMDHKARQIGFSEKMAGMVLGYNFSFIRASQNIIVAGTSDDSDNTFNKTNNGLLYLRNTQFYKDRKRGGDRSDYIEAKNFKSFIISLTAKDNPQTVNRYTPYYCIFEESGKWQQGVLLKAYEYVRPAQEAEGKKTGYSIIGGTGGEGDSGVDDAQEMCYHPESYNLLSFPNIWEEDSDENTARTCHFIPKSYYHIIDEEGNSQVQQSKELILKKRSEMTPKSQYINISQDALYLSDSFYIPTGGFFGPAIIGNINKRIAYINNHREEQIGTRIRVEWKDKTDWSKGVYWEADKDSTIIMYEEPQLDRDDKPISNLYKAATDSYDQDVSRTSNSKGAFFVMKSFYNAESTSNMWVCRMLDRPDAEGIEFGSISKFAEETAKVCIMYGAKNLIEHSKLLIFKWYVDNGLQYLLREKPYLTTSSWINNSQVSNRYGIDTATKPHWLKLLRDFLTDEGNINKIYDVEQLKAFAKYRYDKAGVKYNCDITIASALNIVSLEEEKKFIIGEEEKKIATRIVYKTVNGILKQVAI